MEGFRLRSLGAFIFLPTTLFSIGLGAVVPAVPLLATDLGSSLALAGVVAGTLTVGQLVGDIPSGWVIARVGERYGIVGAALLSALGVLIGFAAEGPGLFGLGMLLVGLSVAVFNLARHAFMTGFVPLSHRARALAMLGGTFRLGMSVGPFLTAALIQLTGSTWSALWVHLVACLSVVVVMSCLPEPIASANRPSRAGPAPTGTGRTADDGVMATLWARRDVLLRLGGGAMLVGAMRASRQVALPLWAVSIGVEESVTALVVGVAGLVDFALFYASGQIMDRWGRLWSALPSMLGLGGGHLLLALSGTFGYGFWWFAAAALVLAVGNGLGNGILMTIGSDLADPVRPAPFLGAWRFTSDIGAAAAPLLLSAVTAAASLAAGMATMGALGLAGAGLFLRYLPRYLPRRGEDA